jgi:hypothetical protein
MSRSGTLSGEAIAPRHPAGAAVGLDTGAKFGERSSILIV